MKREDVKWIVGIFGGGAVALSSSFHLFPWIPENVQHYIGLIAFLWTVVSAKMQSSPLPSKFDREQHVFTENDKDDAGSVDGHSV